jgi:hypothetical protein
MPMAPRYWIFFPTDRSEAGFSEGNGDWNALLGQWNGNRCRDLGDRTSGFSSKFRKFADRPGGEAREG